MPHSWCKCQSCLLSGPQGRLFSKPDFKIHQLRLQRECDDRQVAAHAAAENDLFTVVVVDPGSDLNNTPSAMWNSREHVQAQASFSADNTPIISSATSVVAEGVRRIALLSHSTDSSPSYVTDDLVAAFDRLGVRGPHRTGEHMSLADPQQPITSLDTETSFSPVDAPTTDPVAEGVRHIAPFSHSIDSSPSCVTDDLVAAFDQLGVSSLSPHGADEGVDALEHMDPQQPITSLDTETSSSPVDAPSTDPIQYPVDSPASSHMRIPRPSRDKRENNVLTTRALKTLTDVERLMQTCAARLNDIPAESVRHEVENTISQSRQTVERVTRSTPSIDALKDKVVQHILHIQNRLIELNALHPLEIKAEPVEYPNGVSSITTRSSSI